MLQEKLCRRVGVPGLSGNLMCWSDHLSAGDAVLGHARVVEALTQFPHYVRSVVVSDLLSGSLAAPYDLTPFPPNILLCFFLFSYCLSLARG